MDSSGSQKKDKQPGGPRKHKTTYPKVLYFTALVGFVMAAWILIHEKLLVDHIEQPPATQSEPSPPPAVEPGDYSMLLGRWQRPDGGYIIDITRINPDGTMQAAYYNPRPINVSKALVSGKAPNIQIFIELNDAGYPGATYVLAYDPQNDVLTGIYNQPAVGQRFEVFFIKLE